MHSSAYMCVCVRVSDKFQFKLTLLMAYEIHGCSTTRLYRCSALYAQHSICTVANCSHCMYCTYVHTCYVSIHTVSSYVSTYILACVSGVSCVGTVECNSTTCRRQRSLSGTKLCSVPDKDLRGWNVVLLQSTVLREMLNIITDIRAAAIIH